MCEQVLGIEPAGEDEEPPPRHTQADKWAMHYQAARQLFEREGHPRVPRKHVERIVVDEDQKERKFRLGARVRHQRNRASTLPPERMELGMEWAGAVPAVEAVPEPPAPQPAPLAAPTKRRVREHHEECDKELYEAGNCTCWSTKRFGPPSERESYWDNL